MRINRFAIFAATFLMCSVALAKLDPPNPSLNGLSGSFRQNIAAFVGEDTGRQAALDKANATMGKDYKKLSKSLKKAAGAVGKLDKAFAGDTDYDAQADFFVTLMATTTGVQLANTANSAVLDELLKDPRRFAKVIQKNNKVAQTFNAAEPKSKINKAKTRAKKLKIIAKAAKYFEKLTKRYGRNNDPIG